MTPRIILTILSITLYFATGFSQRMISKSQVLLGPMFKMVNTSQEIKIAPRVTIQTTIRTRIPSEFKFLRLGTLRFEDKNYVPFGKTKLGGIGNITEFRWYSKKKEAFRGFYYGPYITFMHYKLQSAQVRADFQDANDVTYYGDVSQVVKLNVTGIGFQMGTQGLYANNKLAIDWTIIGFGFGMLSFQGGIEAENTSANFDFRNYTEDVANMEMGIERLFNFRRTIDATSLSISTKIPWILLRTGFSMGFGY
ncbi:MAG TPA: hypothetical protein VI731_06705 [Bacteroidia bacterium]|nr:hypothetical protein [Bacteroidia bacterium]